MIRKPTSSPSLLGVRAFTGLSLCALLLVGCATDESGGSDGGASGDGAAQSSGDDAALPSFADAGFHADATSSSAPDASAASLPAVLNGSFEDTTLSADCHSNLSNAEFSAAVAHVTAFGALNQPDLYTRDCYGSLPSDGTFLLGLGADSASDAVALALSAPLTPGVRYRVRFSGSHGETGAATSTVVEVGASTNPTAFGTLVGTTALLPAAPAEQTLVFAAPLAATYLTLRVKLDGDLGWAFIDQVRLELADAG